MNKPHVHPLGYWLSREEGHFSQEQGYFFDSALADQLALLLAGKSICDFGCGLGKYVLWLRARGFDCDGFDGNPNTGDLTEGVCRSLNLAEPVRLEKQYDGVICFEVGEHIPKQHETAFLDNLAGHAKEMVVLSWAIPGQDGDGHVNCRSNSYIIFQLWRRGFRFEPLASELLRVNCSLDWFKHTLMVFSRRRALYSRAEIQATKKVIGADVERLKKNNRSNSSLGNALAGKIVRTLSQTNERLSRLFNRLRLRR
jgi:hypothetical protein